MNYITSNISDILDTLDIIDGTFPSHVYSVTFFVPISSLLVITTASSCLSSWTRNLTEIILINVILLLALTKPFCFYTFLLVLSLVVVLATTLINVFRQASNNSNYSISKIISENQPLHDFNRKFIGDYRGHLLLATSICILAVDFEIFPSFFSKTETYGWSVMDAGVGSFVLIHGLCSSSARKSDMQHNSFKKCMLSSLPLFLLGIVRLIAVTAVGYHKVIPEYGVHWNFFFTLAFTKVICYLIATCFFFIPPGLLAVIILVIHQTLLSNSFTDLILSDYRRNFVEDNKEGICSLLGFVSIYFLGVQLGQILWKKREKITDFICLLLNLFIFGACGWVLMYIFDEHIQPVSRRMANLAYCVWIVTLTSLQIALHLLHHIIQFIISKIVHKDFRECLLWKALNYNGLSYFLLANILTGLVNLSIKTDNCDEKLSLFILILYLTILNVPIIMLYIKSIQLKFW